LRTRITELESEVTSEQGKRRRELDALLADMAAAEREAQESLTDLR